MTDFEEKTKTTEKDKFDQRLVFSWKKKNEFIEKKNKLHFFE